MYHKDDLISRALRVILSEFGVMALALLIIFGFTIPVAFWLIFKSGILDFSG
jgi:hypothetical protein